MRLEKRILELPLDEFVVTKSTRIRKRLAQNTGGSLTSPSPCPPAMHSALHVVREHDLAVELSDRVGRSCLEWREQMQRGERERKRGKWHNTPCSFARLPCKLVSHTCALVSFLSVLDLLHIPDSRRPIYFYFLVWQPRSPVNRDNHCPKALSPSITRGSRMSRTRQCTRCTHVPTHGSWGSLSLGHVVRCRVSIPL